MNCIYIIFGSDFHAYSLIFRNQAITDNWAMLSTEQTVTYNASNVHIIPYRIYYSLDKETIYTGLQV